MLCLGWYRRLGWQIRALPGVVLKTNQLWRCPEPPLPEGVVLLVPRLLLLLRPQALQPEVSQLHHKPDQRWKSQR